MERGLKWHRGDESPVAENDVKNVNEGAIAHTPLTSEGLRQWEMHAHVDHVFDMVPFWQRGIDAAEKGEVLRLEEFLDKMEGDGGWRTANDVLGMLGGWKGTSSERGHDDDMGWGQPGDWATGDRGAWNWAESQRCGWGMASNCAASDATVTSCGRDSGWGATERVRKGRGKTQGVGKRVRVVGAVHGGGPREELRHFVDAIARQEAVTEERRRAMHMFFEVSDLCCGGHAMTDSLQMTLEEKIAKIHETIRILRKHTV